MDENPRDMLIPWTNEKLNDYGYWELFNKNGSFVAEVSFNLAEDDIYGEKQHMDFIVDACNESPELDQKEARIEQLEKHIGEMGSMMKFNEMKTRIRELEDTIRKFLEADMELDDKLNHGVPIPPKLNQAVKMARQGLLDIMTLSEKSNQSDKAGATKSLREMQEMIEPLTKPMKMGFPEIHEEWETDTGTTIPMDKEDADDGKVGKV